MTNHGAVRDIIKLGEEATFSQQKQTFNGIQNQMMTINDIVLQQSALEALELSKFFRMNAAVKHGVPMEFESPELPQQSQPTSTTESVKEVTEKIYAQPQAAPPKRSLLKSIAIPAIVGTALAGMGVTVGSMLNNSDPIIVPPPEQRDVDGSLYQYLEDNSYHLKEN